MTLLFIETAIDYLRQLMSKARNFTPINPIEYNLNDLWEHYT